MKSEVIKPRPILSVTRCNCKQWRSNKRENAVKEEGIRGVMVVEAYWLWRMVPSQCCRRVMKR